MVLPVSPLEALGSANRRRRRARAPEPTLRVAKPWRCILLAVDPGEQSGWAIYANAKLVQWGLVDVHHAPSVAQVIAAVLQLAELATQPAVLLLERPYSRRTLGPSRAIWGKAWTRAGASERRIARAWPSRWRSQLFGKGQGSVKQQHARAMEALFAMREITGAATVAVSVEESCPTVQHDVAAAICLGRWGTLAAEVGKVLPFGTRRLSGAA